MNSAQRVVVLMYHRIGPAHNAWEHKYCIAPERFAAHMHVLARQGMRAVGIDDFIAWLQGQRTLPAGSFLLTFDDGFLGIHEHAAPVLQELKWPATVFLVSRLIGQRDEWTRTQNPSGATYPLLGAEHIHALRGQGFSFHSHSRHHADLPTMSDEQLRDELAGSKQDIEALLGEAASYLAYPYGRYDERVLRAAQDAGYHAAFSVQPGFNRADQDRFRIRRLDVFGTDTPAMLARKVKLGSNDGSLGNSLAYYAGRLLKRTRTTEPR